MDRNYLHGFKKEEQKRLYSQASILEEIIYYDIDLSAAKKMIEIGCGSGAQTNILLTRNPQLSITATDISDEQLSSAKKLLQTSPHKDRVNFIKSSGDKLPFSDSSFDSAFISWVLEHMEKPVDCLKELHRVLQAGGIVYITEVFNQSFYLSTMTPAVQIYWEQYNTLQQQLKGNPNVGIELGNLLKYAGFSNAITCPLFHLYDRRAKEKLNTILVYWKNLLLSAKEALLSNGLLNQKQVDDFEAEYEAIVQNENTVFHYTAIQAKAIK